MSLSELMVILFVALIFLGPKRLPEVARFLGRYVAKIQRLNQRLRDEWNAQIKIDELEGNIKKAEEVEKGR